MSLSQTKVAKKARLQRANRRAVGYCAKKGCPGRSATYYCDLCKEALRLRVAKHRAKKRAALSGGGDGA